MVIENTRTNLAVSLNKYFGKLPFYHINVKSKFLKHTWLWKKLKKIKGTREISKEILLKITEKTAGEIDEQIVGDIPKQITVQTPDKQLF